MIVTLMALTAMLMYVPWITSVVMLHFIFAGMGFCTAVTDTGCQILTRKVQGMHAGPWLGANTVVFGVAGAIVPLIDIITTDLVTMYTTLSVITVLTFCSMLILPAPESEHISIHFPPNVVPKSLSMNSLTAKQKSILHRYFVNEILIGNMVFWFIGGKVLCSSYVESYISDSNVIPSSEKEVALCVVWIGIAAGRFIGLMDQIQLNKMGEGGIHSLVHNFIAWISTGLLGGFLMFIRENSPIAFWTSLVLYGLGNGPCVGYAYDLNNRLTLMSEKGMAIVMFGLNFGASIVPYVATLVWDYSNYDYHIFPLLVFISMSMPMPVLLITYIINGVSEMKHPDKATKTETII